MKQRITAAELKAMTMKELAEWVEFNACAINRTMVMSWGHEELFKGYHIRPEYTGYIAGRLTVKAFHFTSRTRKAEAQSFAAWLHWAIFGEYPAEEAEEAEATTEAAEQIEVTETEAETETIEETTEKVKEDVTMKKSISVSNLTLDLYMNYVRPAARAAGILEEVPARDDWHEYTAEVTEETAAAEIAQDMYIACMGAGCDNIERSHDEYIRHEAERMARQLEISIKHDRRNCAAPLAALLAALAEILNPTDPTDREKEDKIMTITDTITRVNFETARETIQSASQRSAWARGVRDYALDLLEDLEDWTISGDVAPDPMTDDIDNILRNGAKSWKDYSWGGCALIYDSDICRRLCNNTEKKITHNGERRPNASEEWLDVQARALFQAAQMVCEAVRAATVAISTTETVEAVEEATQAVTVA